MGNVFEDAIGLHQHPSEHETRPQDAHEQDDTKSATRRHPLLAPSDLKRIPESFEGNDALIVSELAGDLLAHSGRLRPLLVAEV
jgi:hypothetical protein